MVHSFNAVGSILQSRCASCGAFKKNCLCPPIKEGETRTERATASTSGTSASRKQTPSPPRQSARSVAASTTRGSGTKRAVPTTKALSTAVAVEKSKDGVRATRKRAASTVLDQPKSRRSPSTLSSPPTSSRSSKTAAPTRGSSKGAALSDSSVSPSAGRKAITIGIQREELNAYTAEELRAYCKTQGLTTARSKKEVTKTILRYLSPRSASSNLTTRTAVSPVSPAISTPKSAPRGGGTTPKSSKRMPQRSTRTKK